MVAVEYNGEPTLQDIFSKAVYVKLRARLKDVCSVRVFWVTDEEIKVTIYTNDFRFCTIYTNAFTMLLGGMTSDWLVNHVMRQFRAYVKNQIFA